MKNESIVDRVKRGGHVQITQSELVMEPIVVKIPGTVIEGGEGRRMTFKVIGPAVMVCSQCGKRSIKKRCHSCGGKTVGQRP